MPTKKFPEMPQLFDPVCQRTPEQMPQYGPESGFLEEGEVASDYVWLEEGTLDRKTGMFLCDECYIKVGQPAERAPGRWIATRENLQKLGVM